MRLPNIKSVKTSSEMINPLTLLNDISQTSNSLLSRLEASEKEFVTFSPPLIKLLETIPKSHWRTTKVNLIVSFTSHQKMYSPIVSNYDPEFMNNLPIATFDTTLDSLDKVKSLPGVKGVYLDEHIPFKEEDWNPFEVATYPSENIIGARYLQDLGINGSGVTIAILDTGIDKTHPDLDDIDNDESTDDPKVILEASFIDFDRDGINDTSPMDDHFHGTHVAGIAAGSGYLNGVAPGAYIMNGKVLDRTIGGYTSWIVKGIDWAITNGANIISMSLGGLPGDSEPLFEEAINSAWEKGVMVITSAGNSGPEPNSISSPGMESRAITVGASDVYNNVTFFSSRGPSPNGIVDPDLVAPGRGILSLEPGGGYTIASGTSMSAPAVAGVAALLLSYNCSKDLGASIDNIRSSMLSTAFDMGVHVFTQGAGLVNASAAAEALHDPLVFAYPSFVSSSPLILSPRESFNYQLDVFLNQSYNTLSVSSSLEPYVNVSFVDLNTEGWIRARVNVTMPNSAMNGLIIVKNGSDILYNTLLYLQPDIESNDANSGTDAGETFFGAIPLTIGIPVEGEVHTWDRDLYSFTVIKDQCYSVILSNLTGNLNLIITDENGTYFNHSSNRGHLPEEAMFKAQSSGNYYIRIEDKTPGRYSLLIQKVAEERLLFYQPAYFTGKIESSTSDFDSDALYDELRFSIEVNVSKAGKYNFWYSVAQNRLDYFFGRYVFVWDWLNLTLNEGTQNLIISVPGGILESSGYNGSYIINELALGKGNFSLLLNHDFEVYTTSIYNCTSFDPLENRLNSYNIEKEDLDGNNSPEKLKVNLEFEFLTTGVYGVGIPIYNENQNELLAYEIETFSVSQVGLTSVSIEFIVQQFHKISDIAVFGVVGSWFRYHIPIFSGITKEELSNSDSIIDFELIDYPHDSDQNGKDDAIRLKFNITSKINTKIIVFSGHPYSYPNETMILVNTSEKTILLDQGFNTFWIDFDAGIFNVNDLSGPYFFPNLGIRFKEYEFTLYYPYVTRNYSASNFESSDVWFSSLFSSLKYENTTDSGIEVNWEVTSNSQIDVFFEFEIRDYEPIQGSFSKIINFTKQISIGSTNLNFRIGAQDLFNSSYIGSLELYTASIFLPEYQNGLRHRYQENELSLIDFVFHAAILPSVNYEDYTTYVDAYFIKSPQIKLDDSGLSTNVSIGINKVGTYDLDIDLYSKNDYSTQNIRNTTKLKITEIGNYSHIFHFSLKTIKRNGFDESFFGNISLINLESSYKSKLIIPHMSINQSNLKYALPLQAISVTSDRTLDEDQDGMLDTIEVKMLIDVGQENDYNFSAKIHAQFNNFYEAYLGSVSLSSMHFLPGLHNISLLIPYYFFLASYNEATDLDLLPIVELFIVPLYSFDPEGKFVVSTKPLFIEKEYDLRDFLMTHPLSIGYVRITQGYSDGVPEKLEVNVVISIKKILPFSLKVSLEVFWDKSTVSVDKINLPNPTNTGNINSKIIFMFSEIFSSNPPYQYNVKALITVVTFDGIKIDDYVMPVAVSFITEPIRVITTSSQITSLTTTTSRRTNGFEVLSTILAVVSCLLILKKKKEK
ncbi:MAG: S8 family serine peptidase [Promethearchaeota archaeon]